MSLCPLIRLSGHPALLTCPLPAARRPCPPCSAHRPPLVRAPECRLPWSRAGAPSHHRLQAPRASAAAVQEDAPACARGEKSALSCAPQMDARCRRRLPARAPPRPAPDTWCQRRGGAPWPPPHLRAPAQPLPCQPSSIPCRGDALALAVLFCTWPGVWAGRSKMRCWEDRQGRGPTRGWESFPPLLGPSVASQHVYPVPNVTSSEGDRQSPSSRSPTHTRATGLSQHLGSSTGRAATRLPGLRQKGLGWQRHSAPQEDGKKAAPHSLRMWKKLFPGNSPAPKQGYAPRPHPRRSLGALLRAGFCT